MPRVKKEIPEAEVEVKKVSQKKNSTRSASSKTQTAKKETSKSKKDVIEKVVEKELSSKKEYKQKAFFFPRLIAYIIDAMIISLVVSGILMFDVINPCFSNLLSKATPHFSQQSGW